MKELETLNAQLTEVLLAKDEVSELVQQIVHCI